MRLRGLEKQFLRQVQRTIQREDLFPRDSRILVACSGGVDSLALVHILLALKEHLHTQWTIGILTVDHQIRPEGRQELEGVKAMAKDLGLAFHGAHIDVPQKAQEWGQSLEMAGRRVRYSFMTHIALEAGYDRVALAHHKDDQGETILSHIIRGSGLKGLGGMTYKRPLLESIFLVRPLLDVSKEDIRAYAKSLPYAPYEDSTNEDRRYQRNYIRHEVVPLLQRLNPTISDALSRLGESARDDQALLENMASQRLEQLATYQEGVLRLGRRAFRKEPISLQRRMWSLALELLKPGAHWEWSHLEQLHQIIKSGEPKSFQANGVRVQAQCDTIEISVL